MMRRPERGKGGGMERELSVRVQNLGSHRWGRADLELSREGAKKERALSMLSRAP